MSLPTELQEDRLLVKEDDKSSRHSLYSILKSSSDSCENLKPDGIPQSPEPDDAEKKRRRKNRNQPEVAQVDKPIEAQKDWHLYKALLRQRFKMASKHFENHQLNEFQKAKATAQDNSKKLREQRYHLNDIGDFNLMEQALKLKEEQAKFMFKMFEQQSQSEVQARIDGFLTALFKYWVKKSTSKYLRISKFFQNMVVFGLASSTAYLENVLANYSEKIQQPAFSYVTNPNPKLD